MTDSQRPADLLFGANLVAMATPMHPDGTISEPGLADLVDHLLATGATASWWAAPPVSPPP